MTLSEVVITALDFFMKQHKDIFGEYKGEIDESAIQENKSSLVFAYCDKELVNKIWKTLQRINQVNTPAIKFVITSYSIHYTKLYESITGKFT